MSSLVAARSTASLMAIPSEPVVFGNCSKILRPASVALEGEGNQRILEQNAGNITIITKFLSLKNGGAISTTSTIAGSSSGDIEIFTNNLELDNQGLIIAESFSGKEGNIRIQVAENLFLRKNIVESALYVKKK